MVTTMVPVSGSHLATLTGRINWQLLHGLSPTETVALLIESIKKDSEGRDRGVTHCAAEGIPDCPFGLKFYTYLGLTSVEFQVWGGMSNTSYIYCKIISPSIGGEEGLEVETGIEETPLVTDREAALDRMFFFIELVLDRPIC